MRWSRKGHLFVAGVIAVLVVTGLIHAFFPQEGSLPNEYNTNASEFLAREYGSVLKPKVLHACQSNTVEVLLIVASAVSNLDARTAVRDSWLPYLPSTYHLIFFLGSTEIAILQGQINEESRKFQDIFQDPRFIDSYYNLTFKSLALLQWTNKFCSSAKYLLKIDDDMYLNIQKFHDLTTCITHARNNIYVSKGTTGNNMETTGYNEPSNCSQVKPYNLINYYINSESHEYESYFFGGYLYVNVKADRNPNSKWYLHPKVYSATILPPFLSGTAYILTTNLIQHLLYACKYEPIIPLEDVYISGLLGSKGLKLKLSHVEGWSRFRPRWNTLCLFHDLLTAHGLSPSELLSITSSVSNLDKGECDTLGVHFINYFNTIISHFFPKIT